MTNRLLRDRHAPFGMPPLGGFADADFAPAFAAALAEGRADGDAIAGNPEVPSFANTGQAMDRAEKALDRRIRAAAIACGHFFAAPGGGQGVGEAGGMRSGGMRRAADEDAPRWPFDA